MVPVACRTLPVMHIAMKCDNYCFCHCPENEKEGIHASKTYLKKEMMPCYPATWLKVTKYILLFVLS